MNIAWAYGPSTGKDASIALVRKAYESGIRFFDTAEIYGPFISEQIVGEALEPYRNEVVLASKIGFDIDFETGEQHGLNSKPDHIKLVVDDMLKRLRTDRIDLLYQHRVDPQVPIEDVAGAVQDLMAQGKVLHWGLCEMGPNTLRRAHATLPVAAVQNEYSMAWRGPEDQVVPICEELGIGFVAWWPLACQLLTGWIDADTRYVPGDIRGITSRYAPEHIAQNLKLVDVVKDWAARKEVSPAQIALAWLLGRKPWIVPIPGTTKTTRLEENAGATAVELTASDLDLIASALAGIEVQGARYSEGGQRMIDR
ncbi:MAG: aldo/keto reductase, partial [Flavobacteriales bacterium]|nr:aldo/keto reductase [Flavobacteriales bacterium]